jgi:hypothetical protein
MPKGKHIKDLEELKKLATYDEEHEDPLECAIQLNFGAYSRKDIQWFPEEKLWRVFHYIDEEGAEYGEDSDDERWAFILEALKEGALFRLL